MTLKERILHVARDIGLKLHVQVDSAGDFGLTLTRNEF